MTKKTNDVFADLIGLETAEVKVKEGVVFTLTSLVPADVQKAAKVATNKKGNLDDAKFKNNMLALSLSKVHGEVDASMFESKEMPVKNLGKLMLAMNKLNGFDLLMAEALEEAKEAAASEDDDEDQ